MAFLRKEIIYPIAGLVCLAIGVLILNAGLNVHSGEIFLWLIGLFGFSFIFPIALFFTSIQVIKSIAVASVQRMIAIILTTILGVTWTVLLVVGILKEF